MKRLIICIITVALMISYAYADSCPLPVPNTNAEILFSGFDWYSDYAATLRAAKSKGMDTTWIMDTFETNLGTYAMHWDNLYDIFSDSEKDTGGSFILVDCPKVAGYDVLDLMLYCMYNPEIGYTKDYKATDAIQFYMAVYELNVTNYSEVYKDLVSKLKKLYGDNPLESDRGSGIEFSCWVNEDNALVGVCNNNYYIRLLYMAPGAEEKLCQVEKLIQQQEVQNAADDFSGL